jgi:hypothetical protein
MLSRYRAWRRHIGALALLALVCGAAGVAWWLRVGPNADPFRGIELLPPSAADVRAAPYGPDALRSWSRSYTYTTADAMPAIRAFYQAELARRGWQRCPPGRCSGYILNGRGAVSSDIYHRATDTAFNGAAITIQIYPTDAGYSVQVIEAEPADPLVTPAP